MKTEDLCVYRKQYEGEYTAGEVVFRGERIMFSLEDTVRAVGEKEYGRTAIPMGVYDMELTFSPKFKRLLPELFRVPDFSYIRIHSGFSAEDSHGCLLVGLKQASEGSRIYQSRKAERELVNLIELHDIKKIQVIDSRAVTNV